MLYLKRFNESFTSIFDQIKNIKCDLINNGFDLSFKNDEFIDIVINKISDKPDDYFLKKIKDNIGRDLTDYEIDKMFSKPMEIPFIWGDIKLKLINYLKYIDTTFYIENIEIDDNSYYKLSNLINNDDIYDDLELTSIIIHINNNIKKTNINFEKDLSEFCQNNLVYLIDDGITFDIIKCHYSFEKNSNKFVDLIIKFNDMNWNDIKNDFIPFFELLLDKYKLKDTLTGVYNNKKIECINLYAYYNLKRLKSDDFKENIIEDNIPDDAIIDSIIIKINAL